METTQIEWLGIQILEPITTLTDLATAAVCFWAFRQLGPEDGRPGNTSFRLYFLCMGLANLLGGLTGHAFLYLFTPAWKALGWAFSPIAIFFLERSALYDAAAQLQPRSSRRLQQLLTAKLSITLALLVALPINGMHYTAIFKVVQCNVALGMIGLVLPMHLMRYQKLKCPGSRLVLWGILLGILPGIIFNQQIGFGRWFNHLDFSHVLMAGITFIFFRGAKALQTGTAVLQPASDVPN